MPETCPVGGKTVDVLSLSELEGIRDNSSVLDKFVEKLNDGLRGSACREELPASFTLTVAKEDLNEAQINSLETAFEDAGYQFSYEYTNRDTEAWLLKVRERDC